MENLNQCIIGLGSNREKELHIEEASRILSAWFTNICFSPAHLSTPVTSKKNVADYLNRTAIAWTDKSREETIFFLKETEKRMGRKESDKESGSIPIDLDLVKWNETILKEKEWYQAYFQKGLQSLPTLH